MRSYIIETPFTINGIEYEMSRPINYTIVVHEGFEYVSCEELDIFACVDPIGRESVFEEELMMIFSEYALEDNTNLTQDAIQLKNRALQYLLKRGGPYESLR